MEIFGGIVVLLIMIVLSGLKVVKEYDRMIVFRFGKAIAVKGPGLQLVIPVIERARFIDTRTTTMSLDMIEEITSDNFTIKVSAVCLFRISDPKKAALKIDDANKVTRELVQITLRHFVSQHHLRNLISDRGHLNRLLKTSVAKQATEWGVEIQRIDIKEIRIPKDVRRLLARRHLELDHERDHQLRKAERLLTAHNFLTLA